MAGALRKTMLYLGLAEDDENREEVSDQELASSQQEVAPAQPLEREAEVTPISRAQRPSVSSLPAGDMSRIETLRPTSYSDAVKIGEYFREGVPVIMNLGELSEAEAKRLVDFSAGLIFGLHGAIERVTNKVFLLSPATVKIGTEQNRVSENKTGFFNQS